jgi:DNA-directed RNA polymerase subunit RPC12/RpoP
MLKMAIGTYPFRCLECNRRFWINIWLFKKLTYAKCPKCLGTELTSWPRKYYKLSVWKNLLMTFGARRYRCAACRHNFVSFRPTDPSTVTPMPEHTEEVPVQAAGDE